MKGQRVRYQSENLFQEILFIFIKCLLSFLEHVKFFFLYLLHSNEDHKSVFENPSFETMNISSSHITDLDQDPSFDSYEDHKKDGEPQYTKVGLTSHVHNPTPSNI